MSNRKYTGTNNYNAQRGLIGHWPLNSTMGAIDLISGNHGTLYGGMGYGSGGNKQYAVFDGSNDYIQTTGNVSYTSGDPYTFSLWAYRTASGTYATMLSQATYPAEGVTILLDESPHENEITFYISNGSYEYSGIIMAIDTWYHIALTFDGTTCRFYVNGVETTNNTNIRPTRNEPFTIGRWYNNLSNAYWPGYIYDVRIYSRALSASEIAYLAR